MLLRPKVFRGNFEVCIACHQRKGILSVERFPWKICTSGSDFPCGKFAHLRKKPGRGLTLYQMIEFIKCTTSSFKSCLGGMPNSKVASCSSKLLIFGGGFETFHLTVESWQPSSNLPNSLQNPTEPHLCRRYGLPQPTPEPLKKAASELKP